MAETNNAFPISSVYKALTATASTMMTSLGRENPIRIGVAIGGAVELEDGELFGPAIGYAHDMESKRAIFPRIAIHESVVNYLNSFNFSKEPEANQEKNVQYELAKLCNSFINKDHDEVYILNYLGEALWEFVFQGGDETVLNLAFDFIKKEKRRFEDEGNDKLFKKYNYLYNYFSSSKQANLN